MGYSPSGVQTSLLNLKGCLLCNSFYRSKRNTNRRTLDNPALLRFSGFHGDVIAKGVVTQGLASAQLN